MRRILTFASGVAGWVTASLVLRLVVTASYIGQAFLVAAVLEHILAGEGIAGQRWRLVAIAALIAVRFILLWAGEVTAQLTAAATKEQLRDRAFAQLTALGPGYASGTSAGEVRATLVESVEALENYYSRFMPSLATAVVAPAAAVVILGLHDWWLALLLGAFAVGAVVLPPLWDKPLKQSSDRRMAAYTRLGAEFLDTLQGLVTLKAFGAARRRREELSASSERLTRQWVSEMKVSFVASGIYTLAITGGLAAVAAVAAWRTAGGGLTLGTLFLALFLSREALRPIGALAGSFHTSYDAASAADRLEVLFAAVPQAPEPTPTAAARATTPGAAGPLEPSVAFEHVTFCYPGTTRPVLADFSLQVAAAQTVAIVGPSGTGKTTVISLLLRFFDPQTGTVRIGGRDVRELPSDLLHSMLSLVAQDTYLFGGTVRDNLLMARPSADDAEIEAAVRVADAGEFIAALPDGFDTVVGERGLRLSGGQRQRLAIARAVLADTPILVLDEATASVDAATEASIQSALDRLTVNRTTLVVAHRLSTVRHADHIVVLDGGRVVEDGRHDDLLARPGAYARLISAQGAR